MSFAGAYLEKVSLDPQIERQLPGPDLSLAVAIPACNEPDLLQTLTSLRNCHPPEGAVEVIVALNSSESDPESVIRQNRLTETRVLDFSRAFGNGTFRILCTHRTGIPDRLAGAGFARKLAMDHALARFNAVDRPEGVIASLDADSLCEPGYLRAVEGHFRSNPDSRACSVYFEHPLEGGEFPESVYRGIVQYELHLRYYVEGLRYALHPHAYHTVGSAFCVRAGTYAAEGGMNKRSAGEDFYFLQKIIPLGGYHDLNTTCVYPSPRPSRRVTFGTGPAIRKFLEGRTDSLDSYHPRAFYDLREFLASVPRLYASSDDETRSLFNSWPDSIKANLEEEFDERLAEIRKNSTRPETFVKRFYRWFNMFRTLKFINYVNRDRYTKIPIQHAVSEFLNTARPAGYGSAGDVRELLMIMRKIQRESGRTA